MASAIDHLNLQPLTDPQGRPTFLWDMDMTWPAFLAALFGPDADVRAWLAGRLLRETRPEDALRLLTPQQIAEVLPLASPYLGRRRDFWTWLVGIWRTSGHVR